jgi:Tol biopolymer transport system component
MIGLAAQLLLRISLFMFLAVTLVHALAAALPSTQLAFISNRSGSNQLYLHDLDRQITRRLHPLRILGRTPVWSPDGEWILVASDATEDGNSDLFRISRSGALHRLTEVRGTDWDPLWAPDGRSIAFVTYRQGNQDLYQMQADGSAAHDLLPGSTSSITYFAWAPDGRRIAYVDWIRNWLHVAFVDCVDCPSRTLRIPTMSVRTPYWLDAEHLAYTRVDGGDFHLYEVDLRETDPQPQRLSEVPLQPDSLVWSQDRRWAAFVSHTFEAGTVLYALEVSTGIAHALYRHNFYADILGLAWSPDGLTLAFAQENGGTLDIYAVPRDGAQEPLLLITHPAADYAPAYRP